MSLGFYAQHRHLQASRIRLLELSTLLWASHRLLHCFEPKQTIRVKWMAWQMPLSSRQVILLIGDFSLSYNSIWYFFCMRLALSRAIYQSFRGLWCLLRHSQSRLECLVQSAPLFLEAPARFRHKHSLFSLCMLCNDTGIFRLFFHLLLSSILVLYYLFCVP